MGRTKNNLVELLLDKVVLGVAGIAALLILVFFVIGNPNAAEIDGQKLSSGQIDKIIEEKAQGILEQLKKAPADSNEYKPQKSAFVAMINDSINNVKTDIIFPKAPYSTETFVASNRKYRVPSIENIANPTVASVKMAAYVPTEDLSETLTYANADTTLSDVDLVTVESSFNAKKLYDSFRSAFAGKNMPEGWKNEQYAKPVFAVVELQRRAALPDGSWSQWETVPRTKICHLKKALTLPKKAAEYEIQLSIVQFAKPEMMYEILQPAVYDNAIPAEPWLSPSLYNDRAKRFKKEDEEKAKLKTEAEKAAKLSDKASRSAATSRQSAATRQPTTGGGMPGMGMPGMGGMPVMPAPTTAAPKQKTAPIQKQPAGRAALPPKKTPTDEISELESFRTLMLTETSKPEQMEKLVFWAHDDTTVPGEKYQYRIRIGVFNPIAGKDWFNDEQKDLKDQTVLYSGFSEPTQTVETTERLKFFATNVRDMQKGSSIDKTIEIKVARYTLGNWVTKVFNVKNGEQIGAVVDAAETRLAKASEDIKTVDLSTGAVVVDSRRVNQWAGAGNLRPKDYDELLYSLGSNAIQTTPIRERFWSDDTVKLYKEITRAEEAEPVALLTREQAQSGSGSGSTGRQAPGGMPDFGVPGGQGVPGGPGTMPIMPIMPGMMPGGMPNM
ncbi:MAG: hypothetical protein WC770_00290 [Phycisphaerae bacterium]|jgi:hypothetical protein